MILSLSEFEFYLTFHLFHREHPLSALSHGDVSVVSSFHVGGDTFSECLIGDTAR